MPSSSHAMSLMQRIRHELLAVVFTTLYFAVCFGLLMTLKALILAEYDLPSHDAASALISALIVAKVVLILENISLGSWIRRQPAWIDIVARTLIYGMGVLAVLLLEKAFESRHEHGGFTAALRNVFHHTEVHRVYASSICVTLALMGFNAFSVLRRSIGKERLRRTYLSYPEQDQ